MDNFPYAIFLSSPDTALAAERDAARRVVAAFGYLGEKLETSGVFVGVVGLFAPSTLVQDYERAGRAGKACFVFVQEAAPNQRDPQLNELLRLIPAQPYHTPWELAFKLRGALAQHYADTFSADWLLPALPALDAHCVGRRSELELLQAMLLGTQYTAITGAAGLGKTTLAQDLAYRMREKFPGGVFWLEACAEPDEEQGRTISQAMLTLAQAYPAGRLALAEGRTISPTDLRGWMASAPGKALVIADEIWQDTPRRELSLMLPKNFTLVVTAPQALADLTWNNFELSAFSDRTALEYFQRALALPDNLADEALRPLEGIIEALDGHALCLRLGAGWMQRAGGWQAALVYLQRITEAPNALAALALPAPRHEPTERAFGLLYNSLTERQKTFFRAAGVFAPDAPFSAEALLQVGGNPRAREELLLLAPWLLTPDEANGGLRLHTQLHAYAEALLGEAEAEALRLAHLGYYENLAAQWANEKAEHAAPPDLRQLRRAFAFARLQPAPRLVAFVLNAGAYLEAHHHTDELRTWLETALAAAPTHAEEVRAMDEPGEAPEIPPTTLRALGDLSLRVRYSAAAQEFYERALLIYYENKSLSGQANTLKALGDLRASENDLSAAQDYYDRTLLIYAQIDFQLGRANTLKSLGDLSLKNADHSAARNYYNRTLELYEQIDFQLGQAHTLKALGDLNVLEEHYEPARRAYEAALALYKEINFNSQQAATLLEMGNLAAQQDQTDTAQGHYENALRLYQQLEDENGQANVLAAIGALLYAQRSFAQAKLVYEQTHDHYYNAKAHARAADIKLILAQIYQSLNQTEDAVLIVLKAMKNYQKLDDLAGMENARRKLRELARNIGGGFAAIWAQVTHDAPLPDWLKLAPATTIPQSLVYAARDLMLAGNLDSAQQIVERHADSLLTDEADEVFANMLRQYAGQAGQTRQVDKYRALLQRCRQVGVQIAFDELRYPLDEGGSDQAQRLRHALDAYDEALSRLGDIPLVYASIQINRAGILREMAALPRQDHMGCLQLALDAYDEALKHQAAFPPDYAQTQIARAEVLAELAVLPDSDVLGYLRRTLAAYTDALQHQHTMPAEYARTQIARANTLHKLATYPGEDGVGLALDALQAYDDALTHQRDTPIEYARTQSMRALLLYEMAGLPGQDFRKRMDEALQAYDEALEYLRDADPLEYARTETNRVALLRDMAGLPNEDRAARLYQALAAANEALRFQTEAPQDYAQTQVTRANLLREIAGLNGEHRLARMREALATYNEALTLLAEKPIDYAAVQNSRAAILRELAGIKGETPPKRLRESLEAAAEALLILEKMDDAAHYRNARRMMINTRKEVIKLETIAFFDEWWAEYIGTPQPDWLTG